MTWTRAGLEAAGYVGFVTFSELHMRHATTEPGIYVVLRESRDAPRFLGHNAAGKAHSFSKDVQALEQAWVSSAEVLYIGRAIWGKRREGPHRRLKHYRRTGAGTANNHSGGVWIFQLEDWASLTLCWRASDNRSDAHIEALEHHLIADFVSRPEYGKWPFANRRD